MSDEINFEDYKSVKSFRRKNLFYKRKYLKSLHNAWDEDGVDDFLESLNDYDYPDKHKKELIVDTFWFSDIVTLVDFINPIEITFSMAKYLCKYELLLENIKYAENKEENLHSNFKQINPKSFDWESYESNNYKFIISL